MDHHREASVASPACPRRKAVKEHVELRLLAVPLDVGQCLHHRALGESEVAGALRGDRDRSRREGEQSDPVRASERGREHLLREGHTRLRVAADAEQP